MPAAGRLDRLVTIERKTTTRSSTGAVVETWAPWKAVWMGKRDIRATERFRADQDLAVETTVWDSHYIDGMRSDDRLSVEGKVYDILGIREVGRRMGIEITAQAVRV